MSQPIFRALIAAALAALGVIAHAMVMEKPMEAAQAGPASDRSEPLLHVPRIDYRREWTQLGVFSVQAEDPENGAGELHIVYAAPGAVAAWRRDGVFPDGAKLVKDVISTNTEYLTTGLVSYANRLKGRFVMVKDGAGARAEASPLWGDGWGWAFYEGVERTRMTTTDYQADCLGCHEPARATDLIYVQGYRDLTSDR